MVVYRFRTRTTIYSFIIGITSICNTVHAKTSWFNSHKHIHEELLELTPKTKQATLCIEHTLAGSLDIQGWDHEHIAVTVHKKMHTPEDAKHILCQLMQNDQGIISLLIKETDELRKQGTADIVVYVPHALSITATAQEEISVAQMHHAVHVRTRRGTITATTVDGSCSARIEKGDIELHDIHGALNAYTGYGAITIQESYASVQAETERGSIHCTCAAVPSTAHINLTSNKRGVIKLAVPESTEARLSADTTRGTVTSDVLITLERRTTLLNHGAYKDAQQHIRGIIGQQGTAEIQLTASGDIHITPYE